MDSKKKSSMKAAISHRYSYTDSKHNVFAAKFSRDGQYIATSYADGTLRIHTATKGEVLHSMKVPHLE